MKKISDIIQIMLSDQDYALRFLLCIVLVLVILQALKIAREAFFLLCACVRAARRLIVKMTPRRWLLTGIVAGCFTPLTPVAVVGIQWAENNWLHPLYVTPQDTSAWALSRYEAALEKKLSPGEAETVKRRTREIAARVGSSPQAIYEVAYSECGLDPFCIRKDGIAAGWLQFTAVGLSGFGVSLDQVKAACRRRDAAFIMDLSERYLIFWAKGRPLPTSTEVYTAVFAPSHFGEPDEAVLYSGWDRPSYLLNAGLDGHKYRMKGNKLVWFREPDGAITINDLRLALAAKRCKFLKQ